MARRHTVNAVRDTKAIGKYIDDTKRKAEEFHDFFTEAATSGNMEQLIHQVEKEMLAAGSTFDDLKQAADQLDMGPLKRASVRVVSMVPIINRIGGIQKASHFLDMKSALEQTRTDAENGKQKVEADMEPLTQYMQDMEPRVEVLIQHRRDAVETIEQYKIERSTYEERIDKLRANAESFDETSKEYVTTHDEIVTLGKQIRDIDDDIRLEARLRDKANNQLKFLEAFLPVVHQYTSAGQSFAENVEIGLEEMLPHMQAQAQLAQFETSLKDGANAWNRMRLMHNAALIDARQKAEVLKRAMEESQIGSDVYDTRVLDYVNQRNKESLLLTDGGDQDLTENVGYCYSVLGIDEKSTLTQVHNRYSELTARLEGNNSADKMREKLLDDAYHRIIHDRSEVIDAELNVVKP